MLRRMRPREPSEIYGAREVRRLQIARWPLPCGSVLAVVAVPGGGVALVQLGTLVAAETGAASAQVFTARTATACAPITRTYGTKEMQLGTSPHVLAGSSFSATRERRHVVSTGGPHVVAANERLNRAGSRVLIESIE